MLDKVKQFVDQSYGKDKHHGRTVYWLKKLKPDADEAMLIAAYAHDIERAFRKEDASGMAEKKKLKDPKKLAEHQEKGAIIISDFLKQEGYDEANIKRVYHLVRYHEVGGDKESDLIKDADSISFLEINASKYISKYIQTLGIDEVRKKIDWMYERISSEKAKELARLFYEQAIEELGGV